MTEQVDLTIPAASMKVSSLSLDFANSTIQIGLTSDIGTKVTHIIGGATAQALMIALNKAPLDTKSLHRRIMEKLIADGVLVGTISGLPD
jgi:hypothetical protein